jgi:F-type H+-transporting ATPase subunit b
MQIDWWTLGLQTLNFLVLVWLLWHFLYKPVRAVIDERKQLAERAFADANEKKEAAEAVRRTLEEELASQVDERRELLNKAHEQLEIERAKLMEEGRQEARKLIETARESIAGERQAVLSEMHDEIVDLAADLALALMQGAGSQLTGEAALEQLEAQIKGLPQTELKRLTDDLDADTAKLVIVTAAPLDAGEQSRWRQRMAACLGDRDNAEFTIDSDIGGGAELRFPHTVLRFTWDDQLRKAKQLLRQDEINS